MRTEPAEAAPKSRSRAGLFSQSLAEEEAERRAAEEEARRRVEEDSDDAEVVEVAATAAAEADSEEECPVPRPRPSDQGPRWYVMDKERTPSTKTCPLPSAEASPSGAFPVGSSVSTLDGMVLRSGEDPKSSKVAQLAKGQPCIVVAVGADPASRRLRVRLPDVKQEGWISSATKGGRALVRLLEGREAFGPSEPRSASGAAHPEDRTRSQLSL